MKDIPAGYQQVKDPKEATHVLDHDGRIIELPGSYSRSLIAWLRKIERKHRNGPPATKHVAGPDDTKGTEQ